MSRLHGIAFLGVIAAFAPATVKADPPVRITACEPSSDVMDSYADFHPQPWTWSMLGTAGPYYTPMDSFDSYEAAMMRNGPTLAVDYVNQTARVIRGIEFGVVSRGQVIAQVWDAGTFSPAIQIKHDFRISNLATGRGGLTCIPLRVTFFDGAVWSNPDRH